MKKSIYILLGYRIVDTLYILLGIKRLITLFYYPKLAILDLLEFK